MNILIGTQILSGNLGDGWTDENEAADALAKYTEQQWLSDLKQFAADGHEIEITIDVQHNTSGASRNVSVYVEPYDSDIFIKDIEETLTDETKIWENFCESAEAEPYIA